MKKVEKNNSSRSGGWRIFIPTEEELKQYINDLINYFEEADRGKAGSFSIKCPNCKDEAKSHMVLEIVPIELNVWSCPDCRENFKEDDCIKTPIQTIRNEYPDLESFLAKQILAIILPERFKPDL